MKVIGSTETKDNVITITCERPVLLKDGTYSIKFQDIEKGRTTRQNSMLWGLISEICKSENNNLTDKYDVYMNLLQMAGADYKIVAMEEAAFPSFKKGWGIDRCKVVSRFMAKGIPYCEVYCFFGSSMMTTKEFGHLIDTALNYAAEIGIETDYWEDLLNAE